MDKINLQQRAAAITDSLSDLSPTYAVLVLNCALRRVLSALPEVDSSLLANSTEIRSFTFIRVPGFHSKIERNPEIKKFINERIAIPYTKLAALCVEQFGVEDSPTKSSIHRYVTRLRAQLGLQTKHRKEKQRASHKR